MEECAQDSQGLGGQNESSGDGSLALADDTLLLVLLGLRGVHVEDVVATLKALVVGEEDDLLGVVVQIGSGLLDDGETLVDAVEGLVTEGVGALDVRGDVAVRLGEVRKDGSGEGLIGRVTKLDGALGVAVVLDGVDTVADQGVVEKVLQNDYC